MSALGMALRNLERSPGRSLALLGVLAIGYLSLTLIKAGYADLFQRVRDEERSESGDLWFESGGSGGMSLGDYEGLKARLLSRGWISAARAVVPVQGLAGNEGRSAPASGVAEEGRIPDWKGGDGSVKVELGRALARSLGLSEGSAFDALLGDAGFSLRAGAIVGTEAEARDRFFVRLPFEALAERGLVESVGELRFWLAKREAGRRALIASIASSPELRGFKAYAYELGNARANGVVAVYGESYRVVLAAAGLTMLLALANLLSLSVWERGAEWGASLAMGAPYRSLRLAVALESLALALLAALAGVLLTLAISALANLAGGIVLPPPPTASSPIRIRLKPELGSMAEAAGLLLGCALVAALAAGQGPRRRTILELLSERN